MFQEYTVEPSKNALLSITDIAHFSGIDAEILLGGDKAPMTVINLCVAVGKGAPAHISPREDKVFHITSGQFLFLVDSQRFQVKPGDHVFVKKGQIHSFCARGQEKSQMTLVSTPALHDQFFLQLSKLSVPHDPEEVQTVCRNCHQTIVGPVIQP